MQFVSNMIAGYFIRETVYKWTPSCFKSKPAAEQNGRSYTRIVVDGLFITGCAAGGVGIYSYLTTNPAVTIPVGILGTFSGIVSLTNLVGACCLNQNGSEEIPLKEALDEYKKISEEHLKDYNSRP